jgi:hypothetical protein
MIGAARIVGDYSDRLVPETVELAFHPEDAAISFRKVWTADPIARLVWVAWRWKHIVIQHFDEDCLAAAVALRGGRPFPRGGNFACSSLAAFLEQFAPVLSGAQPIRVVYPGRFGWRVMEDLRP